MQNTWKKHSAPQNSPCQLTHETEMNTFYDSEIWQEPNSGIWTYLDFSCHRLFIWHKTTSAGRLFHTLIAAGKKLYLNALMGPCGTWNLWLQSSLVPWVFGMRYDKAGIVINPCTIRYIMMALEWVRCSWIWMIIAKLLVDIAAMKCARLRVRYSRQLASKRWHRSQQGDGVW